ncbi:MAG: HDOD domain-containing protein [Betaproteobacteria bacterium]|nr:HDOD domain-containing protein [Betaproteobacteria bacterium]
MPRRYEPHELVGGFTKLSSLPEVYLKVRDAVESPDSSVEEVGKLLMNDAAMTARLLKVVNSPLYGQSRKVETVSRAINVMGMQQVHDIVLASSVTNTFSGMPVGLMDVRRHWTYSLACALAGRAMGKRAGLVDSERLFVVGLLSRIGHMVIYERIPQLAAVALSHAQRTGQPLHLVERQLIGCDYAAVGGELLGLWQLPHSIVEMVTHHVEPAEVSTGAIGAALVNLASHIAECYAAGSGMRLDTQALNPYLWEATGLAPEGALEVEQQTHGEFATAAEVFMPSLAQVA